MRRTVDDGVHARDRALQRLRGREITPRHLDLARQAVGSGAAEHPHPRAVGQQAGRHVSADVARGTRDEHVHAGTLGALAVSTPPRDANIASIAHTAAAPSWNGTGGGSPSRTLRWKAAISARIPG